MKTQSHFMQIYYNNKEVGYCQLMKNDTLPTPELEYFIDEEFRGRGLMSKWLAIYLLELHKKGIFKVIALVEKDNIISVKLLEKYFVNTKFEGSWECYITDLKLIEKKLKKDVDNSNTVIYNNN